jgi:hypothetical protein
MKQNITLEETAATREYAAQVIVALRKERERAKVICHIVENTRRMSTEQSRRLFTRTTSFCCQ